MSNVNTQASVAHIELIKFCSFYNEGVRGMTGGAAQNDKVWGVARINGTLVNFWGRRNGQMKFKTFLKSQEAKVMAKYAEKIGGRTDGGDIYTPAATTSALIAALCPMLKQRLSSHYYSAMSQGKLNTRH